MISVATATAASITRRPIGRGRLIYLDAATIKGMVDRLRGAEVVL